MEPLPRGTTMASKEFLSNSLRIVSGHRLAFLALARQEEKLIRKEFGSAYDEYAKDVPAFLPCWEKRKYNTV